MDLHAPTPLLGGLSPDVFMRRHWEKKPLLVRQAWPGVRPPIDRAGLFALAASDDVESRLVVHDGPAWRLRSGPLPRRALPAVSRPGWTLLVQGLDLHLDAARALLEPFRFVPEARLDDLMMSWASDGGGVGPHVDAYDVFLLQVHGRRRWRVGRVGDRRWIEGLPLRILQRFEPQFDWVLEPGDMLYLPPLWGHDGIAVDECMTCSVGFRSPNRNELAGELLQRLADVAAEAATDAPLYRDPRQPATDRPGQVPEALQAFARAALQRLLADPRALQGALGEALTEPKPRVWFDAVDRPLADGGVRLDRRTRMLYDARHVFVNGEAYRVAGRDATLLRQLADHRRLGAAARRRLGPDARRAVVEWLSAGWLQPVEEP